VAERPARLAEIDAPAFPGEAHEEQPRCLVQGRKRRPAADSCWAAPLVIYDWAKASHSALELPMAVTAWLFGSTTTPATATTPQVSEAAPGRRQ
jgi:hypothetical protein